MASPAQLLALAKKGDATAAAELWKAIADGRADDAVAADWARDVAMMVVSKVLNPGSYANRRAEKARAALGLEGRLDENAELRAIALDLMPELSPAEVAHFAGLFMDVGSSTPYQIRRKVEYIRRKAKCAQR